MTQTDEIGELCVRGSSLALGYWHDAEKTLAAFTQNPVNPYYPERIYRTGDLVSRNERGEIMYLGRADSQIKHLGYRIELGEIEQAASCLAGIQRVCALYNTAHKEITLFYEADHALSAAVLRAELTSRLPVYMLPRRFVHLEEFPLNPNGKIDRPLLTQQYCTVTRG